MCYDKHMYKDGIRGELNLKKKLIQLLGVLCICGVFSVANLVVNDKQYTQAKELLDSMGIKSDSISKKNAITLWKDISDNSFDETITKDILKQQAEEIGLVDLVNSPSTLVDSIKSGNFDKLLSVKKIPREEVGKIKPHSSYTQIIEELGATQIQKTDGSYTLTYKLDDGNILQMDYKDAADLCPYDGETLLNSFTSLDTDSPK